MEGLNEHLKWQARLAGAKVPDGGGDGGGANGNNDDLPDIGSMIPIEKVTLE